MFDKVISVPANVTASSGPNHRYKLEISESLRQEILNQFDKIDASLQDLVTVFNTNENGSFLSQKHSGFRQKRGAPRGQRSECAVSRDQLVGLKKSNKCCVNKPDDNSR